MYKTLFNIKCELVPGSLTFKINQNFNNLSHLKVHKLKNVTSNMAILLNCGSQLIPFTKFLIIAQIAVLFPKTI